MTYDDYPEVRNLAIWHNFDVEEITMRNAHHSLKIELLIGKDLTWMRDGSRLGISRSGIESSSTLKVAALLISSSIRSGTTPMMPRMPVKRAGVRSWSADARGQLV